MLSALVLLSAAPGLAHAKYADIVVDADSGEVLHATDVDCRNFPASLTKMMTLYLLFDDLDAGKVRLTDRMPVSRHAASQIPSKLGLSPGQTLSVENALLGLVTKSANDAAVIVAEHLAGTESAFAQRMTLKAHELGMNKTVFRNANGVPNPGQKSTARDMATLARALIHNHAKQYHYFSTRQFTYQGEVMTNHNHLLEWYDGADGIKTGYIDASGFNLVASAKRQGRRLIGVVFGGPSADARDRQMAKLLDAAFERTPGSAGTTLAELPEQQEADDTPVRTRAVLRAMAAGNRVHLAERARSRVPQSAGDADEDNWAIEVGTFQEAAHAQQVAASIQATLGPVLQDGEAKAAAHRKGRHAVYRARIVGLSRDTAQKACRVMAKRHHPCSSVSLG
jgi:D-alanyl-D-alanine carboxypeptidase